MITWEEIHADVLEHAGVSLSQGVCQNIAASLNSRIRLSDIEPPMECHGLALLKLAQMEKGKV